MTVVHQGEVTFPPLAISVSAAPKQEAAKPAAAKAEEKNRASRKNGWARWAEVCLVCWAM